MGWFLPAVAGLAAGGASYGLSKLGRKKLGDMPSLDIRAYPYTSLTEFPVGKSLNDTILRGLSGDKELVGFPEGYVEKSTSPFVAQLKADYPQRQRDIQDLYSARGLGRSTAVARDIGETRSQLDRDVNQLIAEAYLKDLQQKKSDEARYQGLGLDFSNSEANTRLNSAKFDLEKTGVEAGLVKGQNDIINAENEQNYADIGAALKTGVGVGTSVGTGNVDYLTNAFGLSGGGGSMFDLADLLAEKNRRSTETVSPFTKTRYSPNLTTT